MEVQHGLGCPWVDVLLLQSILSEVQCGQESFPTYYVSAQTRIFESVQWSCSSKRRIYIWRAEAGSEHTRRKKNKADR